MQGCPDSISSIQADCICELPCADVCRGYLKDHVADEEETCMHSQSSVLCVTCILRLKSAE